VDELARLVAQHASHGLLIDTNLLLLYGVGLYDSALVAKVKRTRKYTVDDFTFIRDFVSAFQRIVTTPHVLAELSNLALDGIDLRQRPYVGTLIEIIGQTKELYVEKDVILKLDCLPRIGVTDAAIVEIARRKGYLVLTDDFPLTGYLQSYECSVINLNHVRTARWFG
jgi:predicted nucleic acid-binding protein